jgi:hypothetical protein
MSYNSFLSRQKYTNTSTSTKNDKHFNNSNSNSIQINCTEAFPELNKSVMVDVSNNLINYKNFKDILNTSVEDDNCKMYETELEPGLLQIIKTKDKILFKEGLVITDKQIEQTYNNMMNKSITKMIDNWENYEYNYDCMNGEGSYTEKFRMQPIYGTEYDTENDSYEEDTKDDNYDY